MSGSVRDEVVGALAEQHGELAALLEPLGEHDWLRPSRCEGWTIADVVLHLAQTDDLARASLAGRFPAVVGDGSVDEAAALTVAGERGEPGADVADRWRRGADTLRRALLDVDPSARVDWVAGTLSATTLAATRLAEAWIHTGDVAQGLGLQPVAGDGLRHVARLAWRTLPYAFERAGRSLAGPVAFRLRGPTGERWDLLPDTEPSTTISGDGVELCLVAGRRLPPSDTGLRADGPDGEAVLDLVRTYA